MTQALGIYHVELKLNFKVWIIVISLLWEGWKMIVVSGLFKNIANYRKLIWICNVSTRRAGDGETQEVVAWQLLLCPSFATVAKYKCCQVSLGCKSLCISPLALGGDRRIHHQRTHHRRIHHLADPPPGGLTTRRIHHPANSPPGGFITWLTHHLADSPPG